MYAALIVCGSGILLALVAISLIAERQHVPVNTVLNQFIGGLRGFRSRFEDAVQHHPLPITGAVESGFWLFMLVPLLDALVDPRNSFTARLIWYLAIAPHEIGHVICIPFGQFLMVAGGSFWQIGFWGGLAAYSFMRRRQVTISLLVWMITAHSLINLSVYIRDAQERDLPLLFGLSEESHDWYNLLRWAGLLEYDNFFADLTVIVAVLLAAGVIGMGIITAWILPRGGAQRF